MEEVDRILILTLNQLGCDIDEKIMTVGNFGIDEVVGGIVRCIRAISSDCELPTKLPQNMAQRFRAAAIVAQAAKDIGYPGDIGYQSLLYPSEADLRKIFMFLIEKLPRDTSPVSNEPLNQAALIHREAKRRLAEVLAQPWIPSYCRHIAHTHSSCASLTKYGTTHTCRFRAKPFRGYTNPSNQMTGMNIYEKHLERVTILVGHYNLAATLLNTHAAQLEKEKLLPLNNDIKGENVIELEPLSEACISEVIPGTLTHFHALPSQISRNLEYVQKSEAASEEVKFFTKETQENTEENKALCHDAQHSTLEDEVLRLRSRINDCTKVMEDSQETFKKVSDEIAHEEEVIKKISSDVKTMERTSSLLPESDTNIQRLQSALRKSVEKISRLQQQWEAHQEPLKKELLQLTFELEDKKRNKEVIIEDIAALRDKMKTVVQEASRKESAEAQLKEEAEKITKDVNRSVYTRRIMDISAKVRKQKQEIDRVLADTRIIQKEINSLSGKLERTFTVVEGTAYKEAAKNEKVRQVYRAVAAVHEGFGELVDIVRETGTTQREISDLREQVDSEESKNVGEKLELLTVDLNHIKKENTTLKKQVISCEK